MEEMPQQAGIKARLSLEVLGFDSPRGTKSIIDPADSADIVVKNIWFIQVDSAGTVVKMDYNKDVQGNPFVQIANTSGDYKLIYVANTFDETLFSGITVETELMNNCKEIEKSSDCLIENAGDSYPIMTGETTQHIDVDAPYLEKTTLRYNVSKLTFVLKKGASISANHVFKSIQLCKVPPLLYYAQSKHHLVESGEYTSVTEAFKNDDEITIDDTKMNIDGDGAKFTFYLPSNYQGAEANIKHPFNKVGTTKPKATYVKIVAENTTTNKQYTYTYYLGANMTNDFNLKIGHHYVYNFTYWNVGDDRDVIGNGTFEKDNRVSISQL